MPNESGESLSIVWRSTKRSPNRVRGSSRAWTLKTAEDYRKHSSTLADFTAKMADSLLTVLTVSCASEKARVGVQPVDSTMKAEDYPSGAKTYRIVDSDSRDKRPGDMMGIVAGPEVGILAAKSGELKVTQNDGSKLVGTFTFKSDTTTVNGKFDFTRPNPLATD